MLPKLNPPIKILSDDKKTRQITEQDDGQTGGHGLVIRPPYSHVIKHRAPQETYTDLSNDNIQLQVNANGATDSQNSLCDKPAGATPNPYRRGSTVANTVLHML